MKKEKTKLKNLNVNSVDLVRRGANQNAHITLYKSADGADPKPDDVPPGLWDAVKKTVANWFSGDSSDSGADGYECAIQKSYDEAIIKSIESILGDDSMATGAKIEMMGQSINEYFDACEVLKGTEPIDTYESDKNKQVIDKSHRTTKEGEEMKIDKSRFTPNELEQYESLIAKGLVTEDEEDDYMEDEMDKACGGSDMDKACGSRDMDKACGSKTKKKRTCKPAGEEEMHPEVRKALAEMAELRKAYDMKELTDVAKKYSVLGKDENELAEKLYEMKKSSEAVFSDYVSVLDEQLDLVNKTGAFEEIGKSGRGYALSGSPEAQIEAFATDIQKSDSSLDRVQAIAKAWEQHPELVAEYERSYK